MDREPERPWAVSLMHHMDSLRSLLTAHALRRTFRRIGLLATETFRVQGRVFIRVAHLLAGALFVVFMVKVAWPTPTGVALHGGFGLAVALQPWLGNRLPVVDPASLQARATLMLIAVGALPLIGAIAIVADQVGQFATRQALAQEQTLTVALAADASDYIRLHRAAV